MGTRKAPRPHLNLGPLPRMGRAGLVAAVCAVLVVLAAAAFVVTRHSGHSTSPSQSSSGTTYRILDPADGTLSVGHTSVHQLTGTCTAAGLCQYSHPAHQPVVKVAHGVKSLPLQSGVSTAWSVSVSPLTVNIDPTKVQIGAANGRLLLTHVPNGVYVISLTGVHNAAWQFVLQVGSGRVAHQ